jgi:hypothetical protein
MRRLQFFALAALLLASCTSSGGAFSDPITRASPVPPAQLDVAALGRLRDQLASALSSHSGGGHVDQMWGSGAAYTLAGPYPSIAASSDALALLAGRQLPSGGAGAGLQAAAGALAASTAAETHDISGPNGAAYLLLARLAAAGSAAAPCPSPSPSPSLGADPTCLRSGFSDALKTGWYAVDSKSFFHVGEATTVYRPVDAFSLGAALVVAGYDERNDDKISAGSDIIAKEMSSDFDQHFGLAYGLMSATPKGGRQATDTNTRLADQAGIAEMLLQAFDASREQQYLTDARQVLQPLLDDRAGIGRQDGYVAGFNLTSSAADASAPVDFETTLLVLQAARHFDRDDGNRFARMEEAAARALLAGAGKVDAAQGLPGALAAQGASIRSGIVTALGVVAINDVLAHRVEATAPTPSPPTAPTGAGTP